MFLDDGVLDTFHPHCVAAYLWRLSSHRETENCSVTAQTPASSSTAKTWQNQYFLMTFFNKTAKSRNPTADFGYLAARGRPRVNRRPDFIQ